MRRLDPTKTAMVIGAGAVALIVGFLISRSLGKDPAPEQPPTEQPEQPPIALPSPVTKDTAAETHRLALYFPGEGGRLYPEERDIAGGADVERSVAATVAALLDGPSESGRMTGLVAPLPKSVNLGRVYAMNAGTVLVDFTTEDAAAPPASGSLGEILTVYSIVNSVTLGFDEIERVVITWNGVQPTTFAGHLDTSRPLKANRRLVAGGT